MAMMREAWTDERLDDLKDGMHREFTLVRAEIERRFDEVDDRFDKVDARFDKVAPLDETKARFDQVDARFDRLEARFDDLQRNLNVGGVSLFATVIAAIVVHAL